MSTSTRIDTPRRGLHPLVAAAAVAVIVMCSVGVAAVLGWLPTPSANPHAEEAVAEAGPEGANLAPMPAPSAQGAPAQQGGQASAQTAHPAPAPAPAKQQACASCGVVESIRQVQVPV
ncbi:MAG: hypothetical protein KUL89_25660, partial [Achromobacter denitrificans]|nr:hypothetical protein [Achromobacter denitrificans]